MASRGRKTISLHAQVFSTVEGNPTLLDLLEITTSDARKTEFIKALLKIMPNAFPKKFSGNNYVQVFQIFLTWFGQPGNSETFSGINFSIQLRQRYIFDQRFKKQQFITDIGLDWTENTTSHFISKVNSPYDAVRKSSSLS